MKVKSTQSRERESRGSKTLWQGQGAAPLGFSQSTRGSSYESEVNSIARKGVQRVEDPLAGSRGSAPWVTSINTRKLYEKVTNSIARKEVQRVEDPLAGSRGSAPWVPPINTRKLYEKVTNSIARKGQGTKSLAGSRGSAPWVTPPTPSLSASPRPSRCAPPSA